MKGDPSPRLIIDILLLICLRSRGSFEVGCVVLSARCRVLIGRQIGALSKGFLVGRSTAGHLILLECGQALAGPHSRCQISVSCPAAPPPREAHHPARVPPLIWVTYSPRITKLLE